MNDAMRLLSNLSLCMNKGTPQFTAEPTPYNAYLTKAVKSNLCSVSELTWQTTTILTMLRNLSITPDETTCTCLLSVYEATQDMEAALRLVLGDGEQESYIKQWGLMVNITIYGALLKVCASTGRGDIAKVILNLLHANAMAEKRNEQILPDETICTCLLTVYEVTQDMETALRLVLGDDKQESYIKQWGVRVNIIIYNALLKVCASTVRGDIAQEVLHFLNDNVVAMKPNKRILPNETTCTCLLTVYEATQDMDAALRLVLGGGKQESYITQWGLRVNITIYGALIKVCASTRRGDIAQKVLDLLDDNAMAEKPDERILPNETICTCFLSVYEVTQDMEAALRLLYSYRWQESYIRQWGVRDSITIYGALLKVCASTGRGDIAQEVLHFLNDNVVAMKPDKRILPDETICTCFLSVYEVTQDMEAALRLLYSYRWQKSYIKQWGLRVNIIIYNALFKVCASTERGDIAQKVLDLLHANAMAEKPDEQILPDETTCTCLLTVYEATQDMEAALRLVLGDGKQKSYIKQWELRVNITIYGALLKVCASTKRGDIARVILDLLDANAMAGKPDEQILPNETICTCLLTVYEAIQDMEAALRLLYNYRWQESYIRQWGVRDNITIYGALLKVCASTKRGDIARVILDLLDANAMEEKPDEQILPNETICTCLLSVYEATQDMEAAERLVFGNDKQESYLNRWKVTPSYLIYAHWALVGTDKMSDKIAILCNKNICQSELGLNNGSFNCHVGAIFNTKNREAFKGVPFKFALALYQYHSKKTAITEVITGYNLSHKLRSQFMQFFKDACKKNVKVHKTNPGVLIL